MTDDSSDGGDGYPREVPGGLERAQHEQHLKTDAVNRVSRKMASAFAEYVIGEAATTLTVGAFDTDAVRDAIHELDTAGYRVTDRPDWDGENGVAFAHPYAFDDLRGAWSESVRLYDTDRGVVASPNQIGAFGVEVSSDSSMPEDTAVVVHPDAITPTPPMQAMPLARTDSTSVFTASESRPWLVSDPRGVVVVEVNRDDRARDRSLARPT